MINAVVLVLVSAVAGIAQNRGDACHVYVVDVEKAKRALDMDGGGTAREKAFAAAQTVFPEFFPKVGEEETTVKTYPFPGGSLFITASVFYTDESMASADSASSMLLSIGVSPKQREESLSGHALAEVTYNDSTDTVRVKKYVKVRGRSHLVGLECHVKPRRQEK